MIRKWLKKIIKEIFVEERIDISMIIIANRKPGTEDYQYKKGAVWKNLEEMWVLKEVFGKWEKVDNED